MFPLALGILSFFKEGSPQDGVLYVVGRGGYLLDPPLGKGSWPTLSLSSPSPASFCPIWGHPGIFFCGLALSGARDLLPYIPLPFFRPFGRCGRDLFPIPSNPTHRWIQSDCPERDGNMNIAMARCELNTPLAVQLRPIAASWAGSAWGKSSFSSGSSAAMSSCPLVPRLLHPRDLLVVLLQLLHYQCPNARRVGHGLQKPKKRAGI